MSIAFSSNISTQFSSKSEKSANWDLDSANKVFKFLLSEGSECEECEISSFIEMSKTTFNTYRKPFSL